MNYQIDEADTLTIRKINAAYAELQKVCHVYLFFIQSRKMSSLHGKIFSSLVSNTSDLFIKSSAILMSKLRFAFR